MMVTKHVFSIVLGKTFSEWIVMKIILLLQQVRCKGTCNRNSSTGNRGCDSKTKNEWIEEPFHLVLGSCCCGSSSHCTSRIRLLHGIRLDCQNCWKDVGNGRSHGGTIESDDKARIFQNHGCHGDTAQESNGHHVIHGG